MLELDTAGLLLRHAKDVTLSAITPRGRTVVELAVDHAVPAAAGFTGRVSRWRGGEELKVRRKG